MCKYAPGMLVVATSRSLLYYRDDTITILSNSTVGNAAYYLLIFSLCFWPYTQPLDLTLTSIFSGKNIKYDSSSTIYCFFSFLESIGMKVSISCSCVNCFSDFSPLYPNRFKPVFKLYCFIKTITMVFFTTSSPEIGVTSCSCQEICILIVPYL